MYYVIYRGGGGSGTGPLLTHSRAKLFTHLFLACWLQLVYLYFLSTEQSFDFPPCVFGKCDIKATVPNCLAVTEPNTEETAVFIIS